MDNLSEDFSNSVHLADSVADQRVYFVPHWWWKDAHDGMEGEVNGKKGVFYTASPASTYGGPMKIINSIFNSDLAFNLRRQDEPMQNGEANGEVSVSGRDFALVSGDMWVEALKWHSESKTAQKDNRSISAAEGDIWDVCPLQLRLSVLREMNSLAIKICKKDNALEPFKRACKIFSIDIDLLRIWDYSGQTTLFFMNDNNRLLKNGARQTDQDVLMELQIYGLADLMKCREGKKDERTMLICNGKNSVSGNLFMGNGSTCNGNLVSVCASSSAVCRNFVEAGSLGLTGLQNLGNTCFMNSALQCLAHTPKLIDYFHEDYAREINHGNPLGMDGEIALAFGDLLRKLWAPGATPVAPKTFKSKLARFAPQFSGYNQHDSQELLAFLLDGLHEDLNRVKCKPYVEAKDAEGRPDNEVADEYWHYHLARNDSIIVHVFQGQYKSTLVCPLCKKISVTFDPFMYLSLPLPSTAIRTMTLTVVSTDGSMQPSPLTISVPKNGKCEDLTRVLSDACSLGTDETLLVAEVYNNKIIRYLEEPSDYLSLIRNEDRLVAYRMKKDTEKLPLVVFMHQKIDEQYNLGSTTSCWKTFGIPLIARLGNSVKGSDIHSLYLKLFSPFQKLSENAIDDAKNISEDGVTENHTSVEDTSFCATTDVDSSDVKTIDPLSDSEGPELEFYVTDEKGIEKGSRMRMNEPVVIADISRQLNLLVCWPKKQIEKYDTLLHDSLPEVYKSGSITKRTQETISLYKCLEAFLKEEPLGPEDMWYCPGCKAPQQAIKKLDLWRLPEILVIHLKRFSYSRFMKTKLETYVDFPIDDLDLSSYIACQGGKPSVRYMLYAISNHYGSMGGGHYTAFVHQGGGRWYDFDDSHVYPISMDKIKTSAAYVLFYRRVVEE